MSEAKNSALVSKNGIISDTTQVLQDSQGALTLTQRGTPQYLFHPQRAVSYSPSFAP